MFVANTHLQCPVLPPSFLSSSLPAPPHPSNIRSCVERTDIRINRQTEQTPSLRWCFDSIILRFFLSSFLQSTSTQQETKRANKGSSSLVHANSRIFIYTSIAERLSLFFWLVFEITQFNSLPRVKRIP